MTITMFFYCIGAPGAATYSASKHAIQVGKLKYLLINHTHCVDNIFQGYFDTLRMEVSDKSISILSVCPGPVETPFHSCTHEDVPSRPGDARVTAERCAELITVAMANSLKEVWISLHPILLFVYISQYLPVVAKW